MFTLKSLFTVANMEHGENLDQEELIQWFTTYLQSGKRTSFPTQNRLSASPSGLAGNLDQGWRILHGATLSSPSLLYLLPQSSAASCLISCSTNCHHYPIFPSFTLDWSWFIWGRWQQWKHNCSKRGWKDAQTTRFMANIQSHRWNSWGQQISKQFFP